MHNLTIPKLQCPFAEEVSEHAEEVNDQTVHWLQERGLVAAPMDFDRSRACMIGHLAARTSPRAGLEELTVAANWYGWLAAVDDHIDELELGARPGALSQWFAKFTWIAEFPKQKLLASEDGFCQALRDVALQISLRATPVQMARFVNSLRAHAFAVVWEATNRDEGRVPPVSEYWKMRRQSGAVAPCLDLVDVIGGYEVGAEDWERPQLRKLYWSAVNIVCISNDIVSYPKELVHDGDIHNLVSVVQHEYSMPLEDAMAMAAQMHDDEVQKFLDLEEDLRKEPGLPPEVPRYVSGLRSWLQGHHYWAYSTPRYAAEGR